MRNVYPANFVSGANHLATSMAWSVLYLHILADLQPLNLPRTFGLMALSCHATHAHEGINNSYNGRELMQVCALGIFGEGSRNCDKKAT
jgi:hypothetical protein